MSAKRCALITIFLSLFISTQAYAGTYEVSVCGPSSTSGATAFNNADAVFVQSNTCPSVDINGGLTTTNVKNGQAGAVGDGAGWEFNAAAGTTITDVDVQRWMFRRTDNWRVGGFYGNGQLISDDIKAGKAVSATTGAIGTAFDPCAGGSCMVGAPTTGPALAPVLTHFDLVDNTTSLFYGAFCTKLPCTTATANDTATKEQFRASIYALKLTVNDADVPANLTLEGHNGGFIGARNTPMAIKAQDASGISRVSLVHNGIEVSSADLQCDYSKMAPCSDNIGGNVSFNSSTLPEGPANLEIRAVDAAGQMAASSVVLNVDKTPPSKVRSLKTAKKQSWYGPGSFFVKYKISAKGAPVVGLRYKTGKKPKSKDVGSRVNSNESLRLAKTGKKQKVWVWGEDAAGNHNPKTAKSIIVNYDADAPTVQAAVYDENNPDVLSAQAKDTRSGIKEVIWQYSVAGANSWTNLTSTRTSATYQSHFPYNTLAPGVYDIKAVAVDRAGNVSEASAGQAVVHPQQAVAVSITAASFGGQFTAVIRDAGGSPVVGVPVVVRMRPVHSNKWTVIQTVNSAADGSIISALPKSKDTSVVEARPTPAALFSFAPAVYTLQASARTSIKASAKTVRNGQTLTLTGRILSKPYPKRLTLTVEAFDRGKWVKAGKIQTDKNGRWRWSHRFTRSKGVANYAFRVSIPKAKGFPYKSAKSSKVEVTVYGS